MLEDIINEYKHLCATDHMNRKKMFCRNKIQCELIKSSDIDAMLWIKRYGDKFEMAVHQSENKTELELILYK